MSIHRFYVKCHSADYVWVVKRALRVAIPLNTVSVFMAEETTKTKKLTIIVERKFLHTFGKKSLKSLNLMLTNIGR